MLATRTGWTAAVLLLLFFLGGTPRAAEPFSHEDWTAVLQAYVDERGLVDYEGLSRDRKTFDRYVAAVERSGPRTTPEAFPTTEDELAFWLNAYNALVFRGVLDRGPEKESVWGALSSGYGFFVRMKVTVDGWRTNLRELENEGIREAFGDPRVHAALNCASLGCPRLPREAFLGEDLDRRLDEAMREFVNTPTNVALDAESGTVVLSKIFDWFREDFVDATGETDLIDYVNRYRAPGARIPADYEVRFSKYDKRLNSR
jgi:hypothetical protein